VPITKEIDFAPATILMSSPSLRYASPNNRRR
jgi:hypothetical protein